MFRSILVPLDGSPFAERAIPWASHIAKHTGAKLRLTLVHEPPAAPLDKASTQLFTSVELATRKSARSYLRLLQAKLKEGGARLTSAVTLTGKPGPALARYVQEMGIDLVVMTTHGRGGLQRAWLGSVADYMVHNSKTPVLLLRPKETDAGTDRTPGAGQILVPLDGSPIAEEALEPAAALAQALGAEITLIQVVAPVQLAENVAFPFPSAYDEEITALERRQAQDYLDDKIEELQASGIRASGVAVIGWNTAQTIMDTARADQIEFVALATHGRSGLGRLALGSVADKLVRGAEVPVLVCHPSGSGKIDKASRPGLRSRGRRARKGR